MGNGRGGPKLRFLPEEKPERLALAEKARVLGSWVWGGPQGLSGRA